MIFKRKSIITGNINEMDIDVIWQRAMAQNPPHIQITFPELTTEQREFILNGITPQEWADYMGREEDFDEPDPIRGYSHYLTDNYDSDKESFNSSDQLSD